MKTIKSVGLILGLVTCLAGCRDPGCGPLGQGPIPIQDGAYSGSMIEGEHSGFPHVDAESLTLEVHRGRGVVEIRYQREDVEVVERWRIKD